MKNKLSAALRSKRGFTLVELIVVLVILAILAALLIPALTKYIDKANEKKIVAETRMVVMAAQTVASDEYGAGNTTITYEADAAKAVDGKVSNAEIAELAEVAASTISGVTFSDTKVATATYTSGKYTCTYANGAYTTTKN